MNGDAGAGMARASEAPEHLSLVATMRDTQPNAALTSATDGRPSTLRIGS